MHYKRSLAFVCLWLVSAVHAGPGAKYAITEMQAVVLGTMGGDESVANDINDSGEIVGWAHNSSGTRRAFLYRDGEMQDLTFGSGTTGEARGINNFTHIVGDFRPLATGVQHAFYWDAQHPVWMLDEHVYFWDAECVTAAGATAINDSGVITGDWYWNCESPVLPHGTAVTWESKSSVARMVIPTGPNGPKPSFARDINASGVVTLDSPLYFEAYRWDGSFDEVGFPLLSAPAYVISASAKGFGINDESQVVGHVLVKPDGELSEEIVTVAYKWNGVSATSSDALPNAPGAPNSSAREINNQSFTVGSSDARYTKSAVIWHDDIGVTTLPFPRGSGSGTSLDPRVCAALSVNNRNSSGRVQAVGYCRIGGKRKATLWNISTRIYSVVQQDGLQR